MSVLANRLAIGAAVSLLGACALSGCANEVRQAPPPKAAASSGGDFARPRQREGMTVEGILGTIPQLRIEETLQAKLPEFQRCFFRGTDELGELAGHIKFYFHVGLDGRVEWVHPRGSSIGHRATELCLLERAAAVRFPEPKGGGPAEFVWGFELEPIDSASAPEPLDPAIVMSSVDEHRPELDACGVSGSGHYVVTAYIAPGGTTRAVGAAADSNEAAQSIDCIVETVRGWALTDPGAKAAKVSFRL